MYVYQTTIILLNTCKYIKNIKVCFQLCKGLRSQANLIHSLRDDTEFTVALDEKGASNRHLLLGK